MSKMTDTEYQKKRNAILRRIPKEYRVGAADFAWTEGHGNGYSEVLFYLEEIATKIFKV